MKKRNWLLGLSLLALFCTTASAEQLYIRNKPFKGTIKRTDGRLWVDLKTFAEAMGATVEEVEGTTTLKMAEGAEGARLEIQQENGLVFVPLEATARLVGARVIVNKQMGTIDINVASAPQVAVAGSKPASAPVASGPIVRAINKNGANVDVTTQLVPGRTNIVEFGAEW